MGSKWPWFIVVILIVIVIILVVRPPCPPVPDPVAVGGELGITVVLSTTATKPIDPDPSALHRATGVDHIRWDNQTGASITIKFRSETRWAFVEPRVESIVIPAGGKSAWFTLASDANGPYSYYTEPDISGDAPGEPVISAGD